MLDRPEYSSIFNEILLRRNPSGTFEYRIASKIAPRVENRTPGYYGNATFYSKIYNLYRNIAGYFTYDESIDIYDAAYYIMR